MKQSRIQILDRILGRVKFGALSLDCEMAYAFGWRHDINDEDNSTDLKPSKLATYGGMWRPPGCPKKTFDNYRDPRYVNNPPKFSQSLDACRTLFPPKTSWSIGYDEYQRPYSEFLDRDNYVKLYANTVQLAACRIALVVKTLNNPRSQ